MEWTPEDAGWRRLWGIILMPLCLFLALALVSYDWQDIGLLRAPPTHANLVGPVGAWLAFGLFMAFGLGAYLLPPACLVFGVMLFLDRSERVAPRGGWLLAMLLSVVGLVSLRDGVLAAHCRALNIDHVGGLFGRLVVTAFLERLLSDVGAGLLLASVLLVALVFFAGPRNLVAAWRGVTAGVTAAAGFVRRRLAAREDRRLQLEREQRRLARQRRRLERAVRAPDEAAPEVEPDDAAGEPEAPAPRRKPRRKPRRAAAEPAAPQPAAAEGAYRLPPMSLLSDGPASPAGPQADTAAVSELLVDTLAEFGIECRITHVETGPVVTRYELLPAPGIRVERIAGLQNNLALALKATSVRVEAPIPGKGVVGVEVPNEASETVTLKEVLTSRVWTSGRAHVPLVLGKDVGGKVIVGDLADMPHLLIAGATGSGKTVCMNSVLAGLLMSRTPAELRLMLVDPKIVEFSVFNHLPHLVVPVITDPDKVALGLRWAINEMEKRYKLFARTGVRNIAAYNNREVAHQEELFGDLADRPQPELPARLPYLVIIIDELADLMLAAQADIENAVARLAQLSRAVGIHMIISTQRPSVNVITGTIKANFPARIAFQVAQRVDSRTILDTVGADKLLGKGDMLYLPPGTGKLVRAQGALTTDRDIRAICDFIKQQGGPDYEDDIKERIEQSKGGSGAGGPGAGDEDDELLAQAVDIIRETRRASTSSLQRRLRIGYTRAARVMDILEERGLIGPPRGSEPREILIDLDGDIPNNADDEDTDDTYDEDEVDIDEADDGER